MTQAGQPSWNRGGISRPLSAEHEYTKVEEHLPDRREEHCGEDHKGDQLGQAHRKVHFSISSSSSYF